MERSLQNKLKHFKVFCYDKVCMLLNGEVLMLCIIFPGIEQSWEYLFLQCCYAGKLYLF